MPTKVPLGLEAKLYRSTGTNYASPVWAEISNVKDLSLNLTASEADVTTRGNGGWRATVATLKDGSIEFQMIPDLANADYTVLRDAWLNKSPIQFAVMSGPITDPLPPGSDGLKAVCSVISIAKTENLEEAQMVTVTIKPTYVSDPEDAPEWLEIEGVAP